MSVSASSVQKVDFTLVSPEKHVLSEHVDMVVVPGDSGDFGVLPNHAATISTLRPGLVTLFQGESKQHIFITEGFVNVNETSCTVLAESVEFVEELNLEEIEDLYTKIQEEIAIARDDSEKRELKRSRELMFVKIQLLKKLSS